MKKQSFLLLLIMLSVVGNATAMGILSFSSLFKEKQVFGVSVLKERDALRRREHDRRKKQLAALLSYKEGIKGLAAGAREKNATSIPELRGLQQEAGNRQVKDLYEVAITSAQAIPETYDEIKRICKEQEAFLETFIQTLEAGVAGEQSRQKDNAFHCSWDDFRQALKDVEEQKAKRSSFEEAVQLLERNITRTKEQYTRTVALYGKELKEVRQKEREAQALGDEVRHQYLMQIEALRVRNQKYEDAEKCVLEKLQQELSLKKDKLALQSYMIEEAKEAIPRLKSRMILSPQDKTKAEEEIRKEERVSRERKEELDVQFTAYKREKQRIKNELAQYLPGQELSAHERVVREKLNQERMLNAQHEVLVSSKKEFAHDAVMVKKTQLAIVEAMLGRSRKTKEFNIDARLEQFYKEKTHLEAALEKFDDFAKNNQLIGNEISKALEDAKRDQELQEGYRLKQLYIDIIRILKQRKKVEQDLADLNRLHTKRYKRVYDDIRFVLSELERDKRSLNIWQRSEKAISAQDLRESIDHLSKFASSFISETLYALHPGTWRQMIFSYPLSIYFFFFLFFFFLLFFIAGFRWTLGFGGRYFDRLLYVYQGQNGVIYLTIARSFIRFFEQHSRGIGLWVYIRMWLLFESEHSLVTIWYPKALFYLVSIPFFLYISREMMNEIKKMNKRMSFLFFTEKLQEKFLFLIMSFLFSSALLLPLRRAVLHYCKATGYHFSPLPSVMYGAWTLVISVLVLFLFSKEDVLRLIPSGNRIGVWLQEIITQYYYPVFIFVMGLFILVNPYVGFSNFAVYLAICMPLTMLIIYAMIKVHTVIRKMTFYLFMKESEEEEGEVEDRFEHAKMYYGFFIIFAFLGLSVASFIVLTRIWGVNYSLGQLWRGLSQDWVLHIEGLNVHVGFGGLLSLSIFILCGFIISSLMHRYVLFKLFDIFRVASGAQNTFSLIFHYVIIILSAILGLHAIRLGMVGNYLLIGLSFGIFFGLKDLVADFFAGLWILIERPIELNNFIETGSIKGTVKKIAMRATTIRTARNFSVVVPNRELVAKPIINWGAGYYAVGFELKLSVSYDSNARQVHDIIEKIVSEHKMVLRIPNVTVRLDEFTDNGMLFFCRAFISARRMLNQWNIASEIRLDLMEAFQKAGIVLSDTHRKIIQTLDDKALTKQQVEVMTGKQVDNEEKSS